MSDYTEHEKLELFELMLYAIDRTISDTQFARLEELLSEKPGAVDDYVRFIMIYIALNQSKDTYITTLPSTAAGAHEISRDLVRAIEHDEQAAVESAAEEVSWQAKAREKKSKELLKPYLRNSGLRNTGEPRNSSISSTVPNGAGFLSAWSLWLPCWP